METVDNFIGEGKPLADRWRAVLDREYVKKSDLSKLVEELFADEKKFQISMPSVAETSGRIAERLERLIDGRE